MRQEGLIDSGRIERLSAYLDVLAGMTGNPSFDGVALYHRHCDDLLAATPHEVIALFNDRLEAGETVDSILGYLDKAINALHRGLADYSWSRPDPGELTFLGLLAAENRGLLARLAAIRRLLLSGQSWPQLHPQLKTAVEAVKVIDSHYQKKENILFPYLEQQHARFNGLVIMWALQDRARQSIKKTLATLSADQPDEQQVRNELGQLFFTVQGLVSKEERILFPIVSDRIETAESMDLLQQCKDYPSVFLSADEEARYAAAIESVANTAPVAMSIRAEAGPILDTSTGRLTAEEASAIFNALPVDLSFVDKDNKVRYFSRPRERIFPRSPAVIGRAVNRCHPPDSVAVVEAIIAAFRKGERDQARFWIEKQGKKILIEYFAVRNDQGQYLGVLEASQDITGIQHLKGQQRLLDWES
jgi:hypothetical protein